MASEVERSAMRRAVAASRARLGVSNPNPTVGAVVLDATGRVVGEGVTSAVGGDHAEVAALRAAGAQTAGGTLVVTLEPCRHTGRTPPCTEAIEAAGVARVVIAISDPHDIAGGGEVWLKAHGVDVESGVLVEEASTVLGPWVTAVQRRRPYLTWKYAATLDGRTAAADGTSKWITGEVARVDVHRERSHADAVVVGVGTVRADDTQLTVRDWPTARQPLRVVVDTNARTPVTARILDSTAPTLVAVGEGADPDRVAGLRSTGADIIELPRRAERVDLEALLSELHQRQVAIALLEGGATLAGSFARSGLIDRVIGYYAPMLLGAGSSVMADFGVTTLADGARLRLTEAARVGDDVRIVAHVMTGSE